MFAWEFCFLFFFLKLLHFILVSFQGITNALKMAKDQDMLRSSKLVLRLFLYCFQHSFRCTIRFSCCHGRQSCVLNPCCQNTCAELCKCLVNPLFHGHESTNSEKVGNVLKVTWKFTNGEPQIQRAPLCHPPGLSLSRAAQFPHNFFLWSSQLNWLNQVLISVWIT